MRFDRGNPVSIYGIKTVFSFNTQRMDAKLSWKFIDGQYTLPELTAFQTLLFHHSDSVSQMSYRTLLSNEMEEIAKTHHSEAREEGGGSKYKFNSKLICKF